MQRANYRSRLRHRRSRGGSAAAAGGEHPGGLVEVTIVAPPGSRTTVWNDPSASWVVVDPSALTVEYVSAPLAADSPIKPAPAAGSGSTVGAGGAGGWAGSWTGPTGATGTVDAPGSAGSGDVAGAIEASGSAAAAVGWNAASSDLAVAAGPHSAPGPKKKPTGLSSGSLMARIITL